MKPLKFILSLSIIFFALSFSYAQEEKAETGEAVEKGQSRGEDPNIKSDEAINVKGQSDPKAIQPADKGGEARAGGCYTFFNNHTPWRITCYVDGYRQGTVGAYGNGGIWVKTGTTAMYSVAYFTDGSTISWGPGKKYCGYKDKMIMEVYKNSYVIYVD